MQDILGGQAGTDLDAVAVGSEDAAVQKPQAGMIQLSQVLLSEPEQTAQARNVVGLQV